MVLLRVWNQTWRVLASGITTTTKRMFSHPFIPCSLLLYSYLPLISFPFPFSVSLLFLCVFLSVLFGLTLECLDEFHARPCCFTISLIAFPLIFKHTSLVPLLLSSSLVHHWYFPFLCFILLSLSSATCILARINHRIQSFILFLLNFFLILSTQPYMRFSYKQSPLYLCFDISSFTIQTHIYILY